LINVDHLGEAGAHLRFITPVERHQVDDESINDAMACAIVCMLFAKALTTDVS
jgi:hypothetical protein